MTRENLSTTWNADPHTVAKIAILEAYLVAWFAIMGRTMRRRPLLYIDGFAGPGEYMNSPKGSPLAAIHAAVTARTKLGSEWMAGDSHCVFIEDHANRFANLEKCIAPHKRTANLKLYPYHDSFVDGLRGFEQDVPTALKSAWPRFSFIDPFGATGAPFKVVERLLGDSCSEVLVNLDANGIRRILDAGKAANHEQLLTDIFGDESWRTAIDPNAASLTKEIQVLELYKARLRSIPNVRYAWAFEMATHADRLEYYLVFASRHPLGLEKMKEAMKSMAQGGTYRFSDRRDQQPELDLFRSDDPAPWAKRLVEALGGGEHTYDQLRDFALNETPFLNPKSMLKSLGDQIEVVPRDGAVVRKGAFPEEKIRRIRLKT